MNIFMKRKMRKIIASAQYLEDTDPILALFEEDGETYVVLTRRATTLRSHRGEIALPGGRADGDDAIVLR